MMGNRNPCGGCVYYGNPAECEGCTSVLDGYFVYKRFEPVWTVSNNAEKENETVASDGKIKVNIDVYGNPGEWDYKAECERLQEANRFLYKENVSLKELLEKREKELNELNEIEAIVNLQTEELNRLNALVSKYELVIRAVEAFVGQKIL